MRRDLPSRRSLERLRILMALGLAVMAAPVAAEEPALAFLEALRERGYYDTALEYIDSIREDELVPVEVRVTLPSERGAILKELARVERNAQRRNELLQEAEKAFREFIQEHPNHPLVPTIRRRLGDLLVVRAESARAAGESQGNNELIRKAVGFLDQARDVYQASLEEMKPTLESLKAVPADQTDLLTLRKNLRDEYFQTLLAKAGVLEAKGDLLKGDEKAARKAYAEAAEAFQTLYEGYRVKIGGLYARMYQARCLKKLGDLKKAIAILDADILSQSVSKQAFRTLRTMATTMAMEMWMDSSQAKYAEAVRRGTEWLAGQRPNERGSIEWLRLKLMTARAMKLYADKLGYDGGKQTQAKQLLTQARDLAREVLRYPSILRKEAKEFLSTLPGGLDVAADKLPETFEEAETQAKETIALVDETRKKVEELRGKVAGASGDARQKLEAELRDLEKLFAEQLARAEELARQALKLGGDELELEKRSTFWYYLAFLAMLEDRPYDAYVYASHVALRYPDASNARPCAQLAIQAAVTLYEKAGAEDRSFELGLLREIAQYTYDTWPNEPEGEFAMSVLIPFEIQDGHLDRAEALALKVPKDSPRSTELRLRLGVAYWREAIAEKKRRQESGDSTVSAPSPRETTLRKKAVQYLEEGLQEMASIDQMGPLQAQGMVFLVQAYLENGESDKALALLEDEKKGLIAFVESSRASAMKPTFPFIVYRYALQAFVKRLAREAGGSDQKEILERLEKVMAQLDRFAGNGPDGVKKKLAVYYSLTTELANEIKAQADPTRKAALAQGAHVLLRAVARQASDPTFLRWAADTLSSLAASLAGSRGVQTEARSLYQEAAQAYQRLLKGEAGSDALPPSVVPTVRYKLAVALQQSGDLPQAIEVFRDLLKVKGSMVKAQVAAARAYEMWAERDKRLELYRKALVGAYPEGPRKSNVIWGWIRIGKTTMRYPKFRETFYMAQYHTALCQLRLAEAERDRAKSQRLAHSAKTTISQTVRLFPDLNKSRWRGEFDRLLRDVQKYLGESAVGLRAITSGKKKTGRRS